VADVARWLNPIEARLATLEQPVTVFFRDDDAGWDDARLFDLLHAFADHECPVDLAVIPASLQEPLRVLLSRHRAAAPGIVGLHQHGWSHANHEATGRKCEFGPSRPAGHQSLDIARGARSLRSAFGDGVDPIFTPPWNRCTQDTVDELVRLGFKALSRDSSARPLDTGPLEELPVAVDWTAAWTRNGGPAGVADAVAGALQAGEVTGLMFHHATMDASQVACTRELLDLLVGHDAVECRLMRDLIGCRTAALAPGVASS